ncbi:MAG: GDSL-type esterase/lipase family protein [Hyphomicrobiales bacterium]
MLGGLVVASTLGGSDEASGLVSADETDVHVPGVARDGTPAPPTPTPTPSPTPTPTPRTAPNPAGLKVWSHGDSTSYFMSVAFLDMMRALGSVAVQGTADYKISSGLESTSPFDWPSFLQEQMATYDPDAVVFMLGANDAVGGIDYESYSAKVGAVMDLLKRPGRTVLWVGQPNFDPTLRPDLVQYAPQVNRVFQEQASLRPWVVYVDTWWITSDASGNYQQYLPDENGVVQQMRAADGVHLTAAGGRLVARAVVNALMNP